MFEEKNRSNFFYSFTRIILLFLFKILYRLSISSQDNIPKLGSVILVANHSSYLDPIVLGIASKRQVCFMAKEELFKVPVLGRLITWLSAFPVNRKKVDLKAFKTAFNLLHEGEVVGLFPEGTRHRLGYKKLGPILTGTAHLALKSGAPVVPVGISGTDKIMPKEKYLPRFPKIFAVVGKPIYLEKQAINKENISRLNKEIEKAIIDLLV